MPGRRTQEERSSRLAPRLRLAAAGYRFRESLFQLPALIVLGGVVLAELTAALDRSIGGEELPFTLTMDSIAATWLLSTVAGATITTAGVVFSMTVAVVLVVTTVLLIIAYLTTLPAASRSARSCGRSSRKVRTPSRR